MTATLSTPIFIIGACRSGTTIMTHALRKGADIEGYNEGHFLPILVDLANVVESYFQIKKDKQGINTNVALYHIQETEVIADVLEVIKRHYEAAFSNDCTIWMDKTPDYKMIKCLPYILKLWPNAKFIFMKRRSLENITSRLIKFPSMRFESHCHNWATMMSSWLTIKKILDYGINLIEVEHRYIVTSPDRVAEMVSNFLNLEKGVAEKMADIFKNVKVENSSCLTEILDFEKLPWTKEQKDLYLKYCEKINIAYGYSLDDKYFIEG